MEPTEIVLDWRNDSEHGEHKQEAVIGKVTVGLSMAGVIFEYVDGKPSIVTTYDPNTGHAWEVIRDAGTLQFSGIKSTVRMTEEYYGSAPNRDLAIKMIQLILPGMLARAEAGGQQKDAVSA